MDDLYRQPEITVKIQGLEESLGRMEAGLAATERGVCFWSGFMSGIGVAVVLVVVFLGCRRWRT